MATTQCILRYAHWLEEVSPGFLGAAIKIETGGDYAQRDLLDQVARLIEIFGVAGTAEIVGCPWKIPRANGHPATDALPLQSPPVNDKKKAP